MPGPSFIHLVWVEVVLVGSFGVLAVGGYASLLVVALIATLRRRSVHAATSRVANFINPVLSALVHLAAFAFGAWLFIKGMWFFGWQIVDYLRQGSWTSLSVIDALRKLNSGWAQNPTDWKGLHVLMDWVPMSLVLVSVGAAWMVGVIRHKAQFDAETPWRSRVAPRKDKSDG
ncbi:MAG: hypothetical protein H6707_14665 [Deltaproteobacteria bacterium]|nr:hypothetical protein [Deltaproteobacteria bacterium]